MRPDAQLVGQAGAEGGLCDVAPVQGEFSLEHVLRQAGLPLIGPVHALGARQSFPSGVGDEDLFLQDAADPDDARLVRKGVESRSFGHGILAVRGRDQHVGSEVGEILLDDAVEPVEHREDKDERGGSDSHPDGADGRYGVDDTQRLAGDEIPSGYIKFRLQGTIS